MREYDCYLQDLTEAVRLGMGAGLNPLVMPEECPYPPAAEACRRLWLDAYTKGRIALGLLTRAQPNLAGVADDGTVRKTSLDQAPIRLFRPEA